MKLIDDGTYGYLLGIDNGYKLKINGEMTPKEKAEELVSKMNVIHYMKLHGKNKNSKGLPISMYDDQIKQCALIAVDEILKNFDGLHKPEYCAFDAIGQRKFTFESECAEHMNGYDMIEYWQEVKSEIENL